MPEQLYVGIELGSTKFSAAVATSDPAGGLRYIGHGRVPAAGLDGQSVTDLHAFSSAFGRAAEEARMLAGFAVQDIVVSVSGAYLTGVTNQGQVSVDTGYPIYQPDIDRAIAAARDDEPAGMQLIHRAVQGFAVNGDRVLNPLGRVGQTLRVWVRDFHIPRSLAEAIGQAASAAGTRVHAIVPTAVASGEAVLRQDERERGVILVDIGGDFSDVAIYSDGVLFDVGGFDIGSDQVTQDLAAVLEMPLEHAEDLKRRHGIGSMASLATMAIDWSPRGIAALQRQARAGTLVRDVPRAIAGARFEQIAGGIAKFVNASATGLHFHAGVVITGGGSLVPGVEEVLSDLMQMDVRCGDVLSSEGFPAIADPSSSAAIGLVRYCAGRARSTATPRSNHNRPRQVRNGRVAWEDVAHARHGQQGRPARGRQSRQLGQHMREWVRGFIPARGDI